MIRLSVIVLLFLLVGALFIVSNENLQLADREEQREFIALYRLWLSSIGENVRAITGQVIAAEWVPSSSRNETPYGELP